MTRALALRPGPPVEIVPSSPFHFDGTVWKPLHFPTNDQAWEPGVLRQTMKIGEVVYGTHVAEPLHAAEVMMTRY